MNLRLEHEELELEKQRLEKRLHQLKLKVLLEQRKIQLQKNINRNLKEYLKILEAEKGDI